MTADFITEIGIDHLQRLYIKPAKTRFQYIYRAAAEVNWNDENKVLYSPKPREWTYYDWYSHLIKIAREEYGCSLEITDETLWINIPLELREQITAVNS